MDFHAGMRLAAGHGRGVVVQDHEQQVVVVEHGVDHAGDAGMEEGGVADEGHHRLARAAREAAARADAGTHVEQEVGHGQGRQDAERVAADVRSYNFV